MDGIHSETLFFVVFNCLLFDTYVGQQRSLTVISLIFLPDV